MFCGRIVAKSTFFKKKEKSTISCLLVFVVLKQAEIHNIPERHSFLLQKSYLRLNTLSTLNDMPLFIKLLKINLVDRNLVRCLFV